MSIVSAISALLSFVNALMRFAERKALISEGRGQALLAQYKEGERVLQKAMDARRAARDRLDRDGLRDGDFRD